MLKSREFLRGKSRGRVGGGNGLSPLAPVILGLVPRILFQQGSNLVNKFALLLNKYWLREDTRNKPKNDGCWGRGFSMVAREQRSVAFGNKVMDTRLPQPAGCGDKYDVSGLGSRLLRRYTPRNDGASTGEGLHRPWCNKILGTGPSMTGGRDANSFGRSMIEMLGVLAIIAVLTIGGIAGYSKAMEKFRLTKALGDYSMLINGLIEYKDNIRKIKTNDALYGLVDVVQSLNLVPETWKKVSAMHISDNYGNVLRIYSNNMNSDYVFYVVDFYLGGTKTSDKGTEVSSGFSTKLCLSLLTDLVAPLETAISSVNIWHTPDTSHAIGISKSKFHDLSYLHYACNSCGQDEACAISIVFHY